MKKSLLIMMILVLVASFSLYAGGDTEDTHAMDVNKTVEVLHWWTAGGEAAALNVLKEDLEAKGIEWIDSPVAGGSGTEAMTVLRSRATAGNPPTAVQMLGFDIIDWAELGFLADLNEVAERENWEAVIPDAIKAFSKYGGVWIAAPVNVHSTNWVWANQKVLDELGIEAPIKTWDAFIEALDKVKASGRTALAHGGQAWQDATVFESVVIAAGGPEFYKSAMIDLDPMALNSPTMLKAFEMMDQLKGYLDDNFSGRDWNLASAMVIEGQAGFQIMGDWAKGEFLNAGQVPGVDFTAFRTPGTAGTVTFNSDQCVMFKVDESSKSAQETLASAILAPSFQVAFNTVKGSVPARTDVSDEEFTIIGKNGMKELAEANKNGTLFGSMAHGHGAPAAVKGAVLDIVTAHFNGQYDSAKAVIELAAAVANAQ